MKRSVAPRLAFYAAIDGPGTLAPRGWYCVGVYRSNGEGLLVSQAPLASRDLADGRRRIAGEAVEVTHSFGGTSGRWAVAEAIARYFPARRGFLRSAFEGLDTGPLPRGSFRHDRLGQHSRSLVRYVTPAQESGQGTQGSLASSALPVRGVVRLVDTSDGPDLLTVASRLSARDAGLAGIISATAR